MSFIEDCNERKDYGKQEAFRTVFGISPRTDKRKLSMKQQQGTDTLSWRRRVSKDLDLKKSSYADKFSWRRVTLQDTEIRKGSYESGITNASTRIRKQTEKNIPEFIKLKNLPRPVTNLGTKQKIRSLFYHEPKLNPNIQQIIAKIQNQNNQKVILKKQGVKNFVMVQSGNSPIMSRHNWLHKIAQYL